MKKLFIVLPLVFLLCFTLGCQQGEEVAEEATVGVEVDVGIEVDVEAEKANIQSVFDKYAKAWKTKNIDLFAEIFSDDANMVIFDTETRYDGGEAWKERLQNSFDLIDDINITFRDYSIKVHPSGTIAWLSAFEDATWTTSEGQTDKVEGMRITWVLEKTEGKWIIVEGHWSFSQPEEGE